MITAIHGGTMPSKIAGQDQRQDYKMHAGPDRSFVCHVHEEGRGSRCWKEGLALCMPRYGLTDLALTLLQCSMRWEKDLHSDNISHR